MEPEKLQEMVSQNRELEEKLTKRNQQYVFDLKKTLNAANISEEDKMLAFHEILPALVEGQKKGLTARQLFGTVSERAEAIINKPAPKKETTPFMMWVDNTLLMLGMFTIVFSLPSLFSRGTNLYSGILTLLVSAMLGGLFFNLMYKYFYQYERPGADKSKKPSNLKRGLIVTGAAIVWILLMMLAVVLPPSINPVFDPIIVLVIGAASLGIRYFLKKKYGIQGSLSFRQ